MDRSIEPITGRAWVLGNNIDTDQIIQGKYLTLLSYAEMAEHTLEIPRPEFTSQVNKGDIIVAGRNFGSGSSREEAPMVLKEVGISCVLAESFARIFYRNAINVGLPAMSFDGVTKVVKEGDTITVDFCSGTLKVESTEKTLNGTPLPKFMMEILLSGGTVAWYKKEKI